jgi:hypothetical protein
MDLITCRGYSADDCGSTGAFNWCRHAQFPGVWLVMCQEPSFSMERLIIAVTDDYGNLVAVSRG